MAGLQLDLPAGDIESERTARLREGEFILNQPAGHDGVLYFGREGGETVDAESIQAMLGAMTASYSGAHRSCSLARSRLRRLPKEACQGHVEHRRRRRGVEGSAR
ncbi:MAG: hypothetical protein ACI9MR_003460 [Myxococcota bacterium]|jgi:hypothetical protein